MQKIAYVIEECQQVFHYKNSIKEYNDFQERMYPLIHEAYYDIVSKYWDYETGEKKYGDDPE